MIAKTVSFLAVAVLLLGPATGFAQYTKREPAPVRENPRKSTFQRAPSDVSWIAWLTGSQPEQTAEEAKKEADEMDQEDGSSH